MKLQGSRVTKRRQRARVLCLPEEAAITYLLALHVDMFQLKIKSTDKLYMAVAGIGLYGKQSKEPQSLLQNARVSRWTSGIKMTMTGQQGLNGWKA